MACAEPPKCGLLEPNFNPPTKTLFLAHFVAICGHFGRCKGQWRNRLTYREKRGKEKSENVAEKKKENRKREVGKLKLKEELVQNEERKLFFFFFTFENHRNLFWVYQNGSFLPGKHFPPRKKSGKMTLPPLKYIPPAPLVRGCAASRTPAWLRACNCLCTVYIVIVGRQILQLELFVNG